MEWLNEPASWQRNGDVLRVSVDPGTDFWRATGYGYVHDNGHVYGDRLRGDLDVSVRIRGAFASQYDQAGIMLRADEETWLKTGLEFFEGRPRLSTVLTAGWSSWMVADLPHGTDEVTLRVSRRGDAVEVRYVAGDGAAELAALVFMPPGREMLAGIVCAAPEGTGFSVAFHDLRIVGREWGGQEAADGAASAGESAARTDRWAQEQPVGTGAGWAGEPAAWQDERAGGWAGDEDREAEPAWAGDRRGGRAGDEDHEAEPAWARDRRGGRAGDTSGAEADDWAAGKPDDGAARWAQDRPGEATGSWAVGEVGDDAGRRAPGQPDEPTSSWAAAGPGKSGPGRADEKPARKPPARKSEAGVPDGWDDELPGDESLDWAKPQASDSAADWDRLSVSLSTTSWNAFAAASPEEGRGEPAREPATEPAQEQLGRPAVGPAGRTPNDSAGERPEPPAGDHPEPPAGDHPEPPAGEQPEPSAGDHPEPPAGERPEPSAGDHPEPPAGERPESSIGERPDSPAGEQPEPPVGDRAEPALTPADRAEAATPDETSRGMNGRGKNKAKVPVPPALPPPADPADEWISLLTADSAEEFSGPGPAGELSGPTAGEPDPE
jgi:uncharacterized protein